MYCDRSPVYFISSIHDPRKSTTVSRRNKDGSVCVVSCPQLVADYTIYMGGCDNIDQMTKLYRARRHYRWPKRLMLKCLFWCLYNSFISEMSLKQHKYVGHRRRTFYDFVDDVTLSLIGHYRASTSIRKRLSRTEDDENRLIDVGGHHPEHPPDATSNNTCAVCRKKRNVYQRSHPDVPKKRYRTS